MPRKYIKMTHREIIDLFRDGKYSVCPDTGTVVSNKTGKPLSVKMGGRTEAYPKYRLFNKEKHREIAVAHCVWLAVAQTPIPSGFEIHHKDRNPLNNAWNNLFCLFELDHRKLHNGQDLTEEDETPF